MWKRIKEELDFLWMEIKRIPSHIREYIEFLCRWFSYFKILRHAYDFDYASILDVEKHQITRVRNAIIHYQNHVNWEEDVRQMNLALRLLEIIERQGEAELVDPSCELGKGKWYCPVYVNIRNAGRFNKYIAKQLNEEKDDSYKELLKGELYTEKAWNLYYKVRARYTRNWWD